MNKKLFYLKNNMEEKEIFVRENFWEDLKKSEQKIDKKYKNFSLNLLIISTICMLALVGFILYE